ncbi:MAG: hypothetical protein J7M38_00255 [Armatimonadetes bacterium]|nr:hypothetical protein [Armatimonadota bacterium]
MRRAGIIASVTVAAGLLLAFGCGSGGGVGEPSRLTTITVTPNPAQVVQNTEQVFTAVGLDQNGAVMDISPAWTTTGGIGTITSNGDNTATFRGVVAGSGKVRATQFSVQGEADVTVVTGGAPVLTTITMTPATHTLAVGEHVDITATGRDQFGDPIDFNPTWAVEGDIGSLGLVTAETTSTRRFTATAVGTGKVTATDGTVVGETDITVSDAPPADLTNLFFLHHSTGEGFVVEGDMRGWIAGYNAAHGTHYELWDHGYNYQGLRDPSGTWVGMNYNIPDDNTDPDGLHTLWTTNNTARATIMQRHQVIAFKSCFPASAIPDAATLNQYKQWYLDMRTYFDAHPEKLFVVMSTPPLHRLSTNTTEADNARAFADWLKSADYLDGHANVVCFDLFDMLARADDGSATRNMLRYDYEQSHSDGDSHPNTAANQVVGPALAEFMVNAAAAYHP